MKLKTVQTFIVGALLTGLGVVVVVMLLQQHYVWQNEAFFHTVDQDYGFLDQHLTQILGKKVDYDQSTECYYWKKPEFSIPEDNGPLGCFKSRAYYFPVQRMEDALSLETTIASVVDRAFANVQNRGSSIPPVSVSEQSFYTMNTSSEHPQIPGACFFTMTFPFHNPPAFHLPARQSSQALMLEASCGGDAVRSYYHFINQ